MQFEKTECLTVLNFNRNYRYRILHPGQDHLWKLGFESSNYGYSREVKFCARMIFAMIDDIVII